MDVSPLNGKVIGATICEAVRQASEERTQRRWSDLHSAHATEHEVRPEQFRRTARKKTSRTSFYLTIS